MTLLCLCPPGTKIYSLRISRIVSAVWRAASKAALLLVLQVELRVNFSNIANIFLEAILIELIRVDFYAMVALRYRSLDENLLVRFAYPSTITIRFTWKS